MDPEADNVPPRRLYAATKRSERPSDNPSNGTGRPMSAATSVGRFLQVKLGLQDASAPKTHQGLGLAGSEVDPRAVWKV